jgi:hypothetical protein
VNRYTIRILPQAKDDIDFTHDYILNELFYPLSAQKYKSGILETIEHLSYMGDSIAPSQREYLQHRYGHDVRTITYKKMTIIYNITGDIILIRRVIAGSLIL